MRHIVGYDAEELEIEPRERSFRTKYSSATRAPSKKIYQVLRFLSSPNAGLDIVLDIRGTVLPAKVWEALRTIPRVGRLTSRIGLSHSGFQVTPGDRSGLRRQSYRSRYSLPSLIGNSGSLLELSIRRPVQAIAGSIAKWRLRKFPLGPRLMRRPATRRRRFV